MARSHEEGTTAKPKFLIYDGGMVGLSIDEFEASTDTVLKQ